MENIFTKLQILNNHFKPWGNASVGNKRKLINTPFQSQAKRRNENIKIIYGCPEVVKIRLKRNENSSLLLLEWDIFERSFKILLNNY